MAEEQNVTPWEAKAGADGKFDYNRLVKQFGVDPITPELIEKFREVTGSEPHPWIKRSLFFAHRELDVLLDDYASGKPIFLYTGRGPSTDSLHLGHIVPFLMTKYLHDVFKNSILVIQMSDQEKYWFKDMDFDTVYKLGFENAKDIIATGFDMKRTFIFSNYDYCRNVHAQRLAEDLAKNISMAKIKAIFGLDPSSNMGCYWWPIYQMAAAFSPYFQDIFGSEPIRCLIVYAVDQDPYFRGARDVAPKMNLPKPCAIMSEFLPALEGKSKASSTGSTGPVTTIFLTDSEQEIKDKVNKYAYSGGRDSVEEHREKGADLSVDMAYQYLRYFELDDEELTRIAEEYSSGRMLSGEIKKILATKLAKITKNHQEAKAKVTKEMVEEFYSLDKFKSYPFSSLME